MSKKSQEPRVVEYHNKQYNYVYSSFWQGRAYDQRSERLILGKYLKRYFSNHPYPWLVDIGGNFGRLLPAYAPYFKEVAILDYAVNEFHLAVETARKHQLKLHLVAANAYHLPLSDNSQSALICVRVIHHLEDPVLFFKEIDRILKPGGLFIFQSTNKNNLKNLFKSLITFNFKSWRSNWIDIGKQGVSKEGHFALIRNYKATYIEKLIKARNLKIIRKRSASWLRYLAFIRRYPALGYPFEWLLQLISPIFPFGPSNWYVIRKDGDFKKSSDNFLSTLYDQTGQKKLTPNARSKFVKQTDKKATYLDLRHSKK